MPEPLEVIAAKVEELKIDLEVEKLITQTLMKAALHNVPIDASLLKEILGDIDGIVHNPMGDQVYNNLKARLQALGLSLDPS